MAITRRVGAPAPDVMDSVLVGTHSFALDRGSATHVNVELDLRAGLAGLAVVGLGGGSARDLRERVQAAVLNSGFAFPRRRVTVNIAPATRGGGPEFDLAVACCLLAATGSLDPSRLQHVGFCAELALGGQLRPCAGIGAAGEAAEQAGLGRLVVAHADLGPIRRAGSALVVGARTLREVASLLPAAPQAFERAPRRGMPAALS